MTTKPCERCEIKDRIKGERFCPACKGEVKADAKRAGKIQGYEPSSIHDRRGRHALPASRLLEDEGGDE